ncbi:hypothetical protein VSS37_03845 [Candidatus Thiothrix sp. Deng01]|uniref:Transposase n=1 Tax=Candidatus Thiothrix phosphatis TaxID=3112415 RepID=A0ABU6CVE5_9GAMM|nr:hypothetical protein [Candidatus Thiothrix sp. Deng01]MEB4590104.1 hypothetical protein [Candidatus Thiothrix sp. Deng01]
METEKRNHHNRHRVGKRNFQANLKPEETALVDRVKALHNLKTDRQLLLYLCGKEVAHA